MRQKPVCGRTLPSILLIVMMSCGGNPNLAPEQPYFHDGDEYPPAMAPIVVVGTLGKDIPSGKYVKTAWDPNLTVQLWRVPVTVENVLRGDVDKRITVYYFRVASTYDGPRPLGYWGSEVDKNGRRKLLYLRRDHGVLRTACDVMSGCVLDVDSGSHLNYAPAAGRPFVERKADLLMTQGEGVSDFTFARSLSYALVHLPLDVALARLKVLSSDKSPDIRTAACWELEQYRTDVLRFGLGPVPACASAQGEKR